MDSHHNLAFRASQRLQMERGKSKEQDVNSEIDEKSEVEEEDTDDQEQEENTAPKGGRIRSRVDNGDAQQGWQREIDARQYVSRIEKPLGRLFYLLMEAFPGNGIRLPNRTILLFKTLAIQGMVEVKNAKWLVNAPLTRDSLATRSLANIALKDSYMHVSVSDAYSTIEFKNMVPYWRLPFSKHEGRQSDGYLSNRVRQEWVERFDGNQAFFEGIIAACDQLLEQKEQFSCHVESIEECFHPWFTLSTQELFELDCDDDVPDQSAKSFLKPTSSNSVIPVAPGMSAETHEVRRTVDEYTSQEEAGSFSPPRFPSTPTSDSSDYPSLRSATSQGSASNMPITPAEMSESNSLLLNFSNSSPNAPAKRTNVNFKLEGQLLKDFTMLTNLGWSAILNFLEHLQLLNSASPNAVVTWQMVISPALQADIVTRHQQVFSAYQGEVPTGSLGDITCRQMVKVLGRLAESHAFESFRKRTMDIFSKPDYVFDRDQPRADQWQKLQRIIHKLHLIVPVFGRLLGQLGTYIHSQESNFIKLLRVIMSETLVGPLFDRIYSPGFERQTQNVTYDLPPNPQLWQWKHVYRLLRLLQAEVTVEADLDRQNEERSLMFASPTAASTSRAKLLAVESESDDDSSNEYLVPQSSSERHLSAYSPNRQSTTHAYGKSGSGEGTQKLWNTVRPAPATSEKPNPKVSFPKATKSICFKHAEDPLSCTFGAECKYLHADSSKPEEAQLLAEHLRAQLRALPRRGSSASLHSITEDNSQGQFEDVDKED